MKSSFAIDLLIAQTATGLSRSLNFPGELIELFIDLGLSLYILK